MKKREMSGEMLRRSINSIIKINTIVVFQKNYIYICNYFEINRLFYFVYQHIPTRRTALFYLEDISMRHETRGIKRSFVSLCLVFITNFCINFRSKIRFADLILITLIYQLHEMGHNIS